LDTKRTSSKKEAIITFIHGIFVSEQADAQDDREKKLIFLEQRSANITIQGVSHVRSEILQSGKLMSNDIA